MTEGAELLLPITGRIHGEELSLPCNPVMTDAEAYHVATLLNAFPRQSPQ